MLYFGGADVEAPVKKPVGIVMLIRFAEMIVRFAAGSAITPPAAEVGADVAA